MHSENSRSALAALVSTFILSACGSEVTPQVMVPEGFGEAVGLRVEPDSQVVRPGEPIEVQVWLTNGKGITATAEGLGLTVRRIVAASETAIGMDGARLVARDYGMGVFHVEVAGLRSTAVTALVADLQPEVVTVPATAVRELTNLREVNGEAHYEAVLEDAVRLGVGDKVFGQGDTMLMGEVIEVIDAAAGRYTLAYRGVRPIFRKLTVRRSFDLSDFPREVAPEVAAEYDLVEDADGFFRLVPKVAQASQGLTGGRSQALSATQKLGPMTCKISGALKFSPLTTAEVGLKPNLDFLVDVDLDDGLRKLMATGSITAEASLKARLGANAVGTAACEIELFTMKIPMGPLAWLLNGRVPVGLGAKLGAKISSPQYGFDMALKGGVKDLAVGLECNPDCIVRDEYDFFVDASPPELVYGDAASGGAYARELSAEVYGYAKIGLGVSLWSVYDVISADFVGIQAGTKLETKWMGFDDQFDGKKFASEYKLASSVSIVVEPQLNFLDEFITVSLFKAEIKAEHPLAASPTGRLTVSPKRIERGGTLTLTANISDVHFLGVENVERVEFYRRTEMGYVLVGEAPLNGTIAELEWTMPQDVEWMGEQRFYAAVVPQLMAAFGPYELSPDSAQKVRFSGLLDAVHESGDFDSASVEAQSVRLTATRSVDFGEGPVDVSEDGLFWEISSESVRIVGTSTGSSGPDGEIEVTLARARNSKLDVEPVLQVILRETLDGDPSTTQVTVPLAPPHLRLVRMSADLGAQPGTQSVMLELARAVAPGSTLPRVPIVGANWAVRVASGAWQLEGAVSGVTAESGAITVPVSGSATSGTLSLAFDVLPEGAPEDATPTEIVVAIPIYDFDPNPNPCAGVVCPPGGGAPDDPCCAL